MTLKSLRFSLDFRCFLFSQKKAIRVPCWPLDCVQSSSHLDAVRNGSRNSQKKRLTIVWKSGMLMNSRWIWYHMPGFYANISIAPKLTVINKCFSNSTFCSSQQIITNIFHEIHLNCKINNSINYIMFTAFFVSLIYSSTPSMFSLHLQPLLYFRCTIFICELLHLSGVEKAEEYQKESNWVDKNGR